MSDPEIDRHLPPEDVERMVQFVRPNWNLESATFVEEGLAAIYEVPVSTPAGQRRCYLKATQALNHPMGVGTEARVTAIVRRHTDAPVPRVLGVVDDHDELRTPFFLMASMPGEQHGPRDLRDLPAANLWSVAHQTGRYVAQMHEIPLPDVEGYGRGFTHGGDTLAGGRPSGDPAELRLPDAEADWATWARDRLRMGLDHLADSDRFADLAGPIEAAVERLLSQLPAPEGPVLARVDQGLWNVLTDEHCREVTGTVDFGLQPIVPPADDLAALEYFTAGGKWTGLEAVPDHTEAVRDGLYAGYREVRPLPDALDRRRRLYRLDYLVHGMVTLGSDEFRSRPVPDGRADEAANWLRAAVLRLLGEEPEGS